MDTELTFMLAICCRPSVCRLSSVSVTFVHPTQAVVVLGSVSTAFGTWQSIDIHRKLHGDRPRGTPPSGKLNPRMVAKYSDCGPVESYISETVQDTR